MAYQKHTWVNKEIIKADQLNHIENGIYQEEQRAVQAEEILRQSISGEASRASNAETTLGNRVTSTENAITILNGNDQVPGSVDYKIAQASQSAGGYKVVEDHTLVENPSDKYIYLEPDDTVIGTDKFREWIWILDEDLGVYTWKLIGDVSLDLSGYVQKTDKASTSDFGIVKPDGTTITVQDGVITANVQGGVQSFNGRTGTVTPQSGDYSYNQISGTPTLGTVASKDVAASGDASSSEVVMGNDTRLTDARTPVSHTHTKSQITDFPTIPGGVKIGTTRANATDTTLYFIRS